jgi:hypothetical protein
MIELVYLSHAKKNLTRQELLALLETSRTNNTSLDVTGLLLYDDRAMFIQVLEGPEKNVKSLYETIQSDSRHHRLSTLWCSPISTRNFPDWRLGVKHLNIGITKEVIGLSGYLDKANELDSHTAEDNARFSQVLLKHFRDKAL